jgi:hypothetical protein
MLRIHRIVENVCKNVTNNIRIIPEIGRKTETYHSESRACSPVDLRLTS